MSEVFSVDAKTPFKEIRVKRVAGRPDKSLMSEEAAKPGRRKIGVTIGAKLTGLNAVLLLGSIVSLVWVATELFTADNTALVQQFNADTAAGIAGQARGLLEAYGEKASILGRLLLENPDRRAEMARSFFLKDAEFLGVFVIQRDDALRPRAVAMALHPELAKLGFAGPDELLAHLEEGRRFRAGQVFDGGAPQLASCALPGDLPAMAFMLPLEAAGAGYRYAVLALVRKRKFLEILSQSEAVAAYLVDRGGDILIHSAATTESDGSRILSDAQLAQFVDARGGNRQSRYQNPQSRVGVLGAYRSLGLSGLGVLAEVAEEKALDAAQRVRRRSGWVAFVILCVSFLSGYLYSGTITGPIRRLSEAAQRISEGDFKIRLVARGRDEIAHLSTAFNQMAADLAHRLQVMETFNKFHNREVVDRLLSGEVRLGGERRNATIFFSDIRGFTAMSERMEPEEVVEMLNGYMSRMVPIIRRHGGIIDKYIGDAIMAIWGVPLEKPGDTANALRACLEIRSALAELNAERASEGKPALQIGMGLHAGQVIAGNIGSAEKMEYTIIGDAVNVTSRIESATKELQTDLLVSRAVRDALGEDFAWGESEQIRVKGKAAPLELFRVRSAPGVDAAPATGGRLFSTAVRPSVRPPVFRPRTTPPPFRATTVESRSKLLIIPARRAPGPARSEAPDEWFLQQGIDVLGPFTELEIARGLADGAFDPAQFVSAARAGPWSSLTLFMSRRRAA